MDEGKIYITISDQRLGGGTPDTPPQIPQDQDKDKSENKENLLGNYLKHRFFNMVQDQAKQMVSYTVANIGNFTGDYQVQREVEVGMKIVNFGVSLVTSFVGGMTATGGNVVGGIAGVAFMVASSGVNFGLQETANRVNNRNQNYSIAQLKEISGLDALTNGGR